MRLDSENFKFGGAQKFPLRYSWIPKGAAAVLRDNRAFELDSATVDLGVGSAMVKSIKYWMSAFGLSARSTGKLHDKDVLQQRIYEFYIYLYEKLKDATN